MTGDGEGAGAARPVTDSGSGPILQAEYVVAVARRLAARIHERFPTRTLGNTADRVVRFAEQSAARAEAVRKPNWWLRAGVALLLLLLPVAILATAHALPVDVEVHTLSGYVALFQAATESLIFLGLGVAFLVTLESRLKRSRALNALHELRSLAHLVDMHQLDKDPAYLLGAGERTASSPERSMSAFELSRYLDYCSEMLSVIGKESALYGEGLKDPVVLSAIDQLEDLTGAFSAKIWQKVALLSSIRT